MSFYENLLKMDKVCCLSQELLVYKHEPKQSDSGRNISSESSSENLLSPITDKLIVPKSDNASDSAAEGEYR